MNTTIKRQSIARKIAVFGALSALTIIFGVTRLGLIPWFAGASITILHVPVILGTLLEGLFTGSGIGAVFGITTLVVAATQGTGLVDAFFINPLISVLPRLFIAPVVFYSFKGLMAAFRKVRIPSVFAYAISAFLGAMTNSFLVLGALVIAKAIDVKVMWTLLLSNSLLEAAAAVIICCAVVMVRDSAVSYKNKKSRLNSEESEE